MRGFVRDFDAPRFGLGFIFFPSLRPDRAGAVGGDIDACFQVTTRQDPSLVTKAPKMKKEMGLIDWSKPAVAIYNHIRAMQPWPTAYTYFHRPGKDPMRVIINRAEVCQSPRPETPPHVGEFSKTPSPAKPLQVWCSPDLLSVLELQPAGKKANECRRVCTGLPRSRRLPLRPGRGIVKPVSPLRKDATWEVCLNRYRLGDPGRGRGV